MWRRVLVVDRSPQIHRLGEVNLHRVGFEVEAAVNADEARVRMQGKLPNVLLISVALPEAERHSLREWTETEERAGQIRVVELKPGKPFARWL